MGMIRFGAPIEEVLFFKELMKLNVFVETGTYKGSTAKNMSNYFEKIYTIEKSDNFYKVAKENLKNISNIQLIKCDSREY